MQTMNTLLRNRHGVTRLAALAAVILAFSAGCIFSPDEEPPQPVPPEAIPSFESNPDNLIEALEIVYNDKVRSASQRSQVYETLFPAADHDSLEFIFFFQPVDVEPGEEPSWGIDGELESHRNMFSAQEARDIFSLELTITRLDPSPLEFPQPGQETWVEMFSTNVNLRLMFNPQDGLLVDGGQAKFLAAPADDRWYLTEWTDLPRP
jgi:hypothetical protein